MSNSTREKGSECPEDGQSQKAQLEVERNNSKPFRLKLSRLNSSRRPEHPPNKGIDRDINFTRPKLHQESRTPRTAFHRSSRTPSVKVPRPSHGNQQRNQTAHLSKRRKNKRRLNRWKGVKLNSQAKSLHQREKKNKREKGRRGEDDVSDNLHAGHLGDCGIG